MANVQDILTSEEWSSKQPIEKAKARKELFALSLGDNPEIKEQFNAADATTQKAIYDKWQGQVDEQFPEAFKVHGWERRGKNWTGGENAYAIKITPDNKQIKKYEYHYTPVYDDKAEAILEFIKKPDAQTIFKDVTPEQKRAIAELSFERYGPETPKWLGVPEDYEPKKSIAEAAIPMAMRAAPPIAAGALTRGNPRVTAAFAAAGEAAAEQYEISTGQREKYSPNEIALNALFSMIPAKVIGKIASPTKKLAATTAIRGAEGAAQGAGYETIRQVVEGEDIQGRRIVAAGGMGTVFGAAFPLLGAATSKAKALLLGKSVEDLPALIKAEKNPELKAELSDLQKKIDSDLRMGAQAKPAAESAAVLDTAGKSAAESAQVLGTGTPTELESIVRGNQLNAPEVVAGETPLADQAARQINELDAQKATAITAELSPQAQGMMDEYGRVNPTAMTTLGGAAVGGIAGSTQGDTLEERLQNAAIGAGIGAGAGYGAGKAASGPKITYQYTHQPGGVHEGTPFKGYTQIDQIVNGESIGSTSLKALQDKGIKLPDVPENMPMGKYSPEQVEAFSRENSRTMSGLLNESTPPMPSPRETSRLQQEYGFINPAVARTMASTATGGAIGATYGWTTGDTPEDKIERALLYGAGGLAAGASIPAGIKALKKYRNALHTAIEDSQYRVRMLQEKTGINLTDDTNMHAAYLRMQGKAGHAITEANKFGEKVINKMSKIGNEYKVAPREIGKEVDAYLQAKHAPERNMKFGDGAAGMTDDQAQRVLAELSSKPYFSQLARVAGDIKAFHDMSLGVLESNGVLSSDIATGLKTLYPEHVPLQRILPDDEDIGRALVSRGADVKSSGILRAKGSELPVDSVFGNIMANYKSAVVRAAKNEYDNTVLRFARENAGADGLFEELKPQVIGTGAGGKPIFAPITDPNVLTLRENGKPVHLKINNPDVAQAIKGTNMANVPYIFKIPAIFNRFRSAVLTRGNVEFPVTNVPRDLEEGMAYAAAQEDLAPGSSVGILKKWPSSVNAIKDYLIERETPLTKLYQQFLGDGSTTGFMNVGNRESIDLDIDKMWKNEASNPRKALAKTLNALDSYNRLFEDGTRFAVYREALENGLSRKRAASMAREATIDFNKMGTQGPIINSLRVFGNASIQGATKMARIAKNNPKAFAGITATVAGATFAAYDWNDKVDPDWRKNVDRDSKGARRQNLVVMLPGTTKEKPSYLSVPVGYGIKPIKAVVDGIINIKDGHEDIPTAMRYVAGAIADSWNPFGSGDIADALTPTIGELPVQLKQNEKYGGSPIRPEYDKNLSQSRKYFPSLEKTELGKIVIPATKWASDKQHFDISPADIDYAIRYATGGPGGTLLKLIEGGKEIAKGELPSAQNIPLLSRIYKSRTLEDRPDITSDPDFKATMQKQSNERFDTKKRMEKELEAVRKLPQAEAVKRLNDLSPQEQKVMKQVIKKPSYEVSQFQALGVDNGVRAQYIDKKIKELKGAERDEFIQFLDANAKELLPKKVMQQLGELNK